MRLALLIALAAPLLAQRAGSQMLFPYPLDDTGVSIVNSSSAATWRSVGFTASANKTLSTVEIYISGITGSMASGEIKAALFSDSTGKPGSEIESRTIGSTPAVGWASFTGFTTALTAGTQYWIVFSNLNATPASNYPQFRLQGTSASSVGLINYTGAGTMGAGWFNAVSTDAGSNWTRSSSVWNTVLSFSDSTKEGFPADSAGTQCQVYSTRECGTYILTPGYALNINGITMNASRSGTPTGSLRFRIYEGTGTSSLSLLATSTAIPAAGVSTTTGYVYMLLPAPLILKANTRYRVVASETTNGDTSSHRFNVTTYRLLSSAASIFMPMLGAVPESSLSTDGGSTWTNTANEIALFAFIMDPTRPFIFTGGGTAITQ